MHLCADLENVMQLQKQLQVLQKSLDHERRTKVSLENKRQTLETQITQFTRYH